MPGAKLRALINKKLYCFLGVCSKRITYRVITKFVGKNYFEKCELVFLYFYLLFLKCICHDPLMTRQVVQTGHTICPVL